MAILTPGNASAKSAHWYTRLGEPAHRQPKADGKGDRATTIRDAAKLGLVPSVTTVLGILDKPALTDWRINQALKAADASPRDGGESLDYWMKRVKDQSYEQVTDAADLGSQIHKALENAVQGRDWDQAFAGHVGPVLAWFEEKGLTITACEQRVVDLDTGFAGTTDVLFTYGAAGIGILDYKTKKTQPGKKVDAYMEHKCQLAAYSAAYYGHDRVGDVLAANLFISSTEPGRLDVVKHDVGSLSEYWDMFRHLCAVWRTAKGYDPRKVQPEGDKPYQGAKR